MTNISGSSRAFAAERGEERGRVVVRSLQVVHGERTAHVPSALAEPVVERGLKTRPALGWIRRAPAARNS